MTALLQRVLLTSRRLPRCHAVLRTGSQWGKNNALKTNSHYSNIINIVMSPFIAQQRLLSRITSARYNQDTEMMDVTYEEGNTLPYPYIWLRDNCQCERCCNPKTKARLSYLIDLDLKTKPKQVFVCVSFHVFNIK